MSGQPGFDPAPILARYRDCDAGEVAAVLGVPIGTIHAWRQGRRRMRVWTADRLAIHEGTHPAVLWPDWGRP